MKTIIHTYKSKEPVLNVNAFIIETSDNLIIIDTTLTMSDSKALKQEADNLLKPIAAIILTHAHPDHIAGTYNIAPNGEIPIYALASVKVLMEATEQIKHQQWSAMFGAEWIPKWVYPNVIVKDGDVVKVGGLTFHVFDLGAGGDCDANSIWLLQGDTPAAFLGDFIYNENHTYMADGSILRWIANLEKFTPILKNYQNYYVGHGPTCDFSAIAKQKQYFITYCGELLKATNGTAIFNEQSKQNFESAMIDTFPNYGCQFMIGLAADKVASELRTNSHS